MKKEIKYTHNKALKGIILFFMLSVADTILAQSANPPSAVKSIYDNPFMYLLIGLMIVFVIIISVLGSVLIAVSKHNLGKLKSKTNVVSIITILLSLTIPNVSMSQEVSTAVVESGSHGVYFGVPASLFYLLLTVLILELIIIFSLLIAINSYFVKDEMAIQTWSQRTINNLKNYFTKEVSAEEEKELMTDHDYDGIRELDNGMPPWLKYMFFATIIFGVSYLIDYHVLKADMLQTDEYKKELADAEIRMAEHRKNSANNVDESTVTLITNSSELLEGEKIFKTNCSACHGQLGEGMVGPNLTDDYWIHGGDIKSIFKTIKFGVVEKGMKAWQTDISPSQMAVVASYIKSLRGTNPPNAKEKQGDLFTENTQTDSLKVQVLDSTSIANKDSIALK